MDFFLLHLRCMTYLRWLRIGEIEFYYQRVKTGNNFHRPLGFEKKEFTTQAMDFLQRFGGIGKIQKKAAVPERGALHHEK